MQTKAVTKNIELELKKCSFMASTKTSNQRSLISTEGSTDENAEISWLVQMEICRHRVEPQRCCTDNEVASLL